VRLPTLGPVAHHLLAPTANGAQSLPARLIGRGPGADDRAGGALALAASPGVLGSTGGALIGWLLGIGVARADTVRALVEVGPDGPTVLEAWIGQTAPPPGPGALRVLGADGGVLAVAGWRDPRLRSVIFPDGGGAAGHVERARIIVDLPWPRGAASLALGPGTARPTARPAARRAAVPLGGAPVPLLESGPADARLDLVILGDGYRADDLALFGEDVDRVVDHLLSIDPYGEYRGLLNVWRLDVISAESGASHAEGQAWSATPRSAVPTAASGSIGWCAATTPR